MTTTATMNRSALDSGIYLMRRAADEDAKGNTNASLELYFASLDSFLFSIPIEALSAQRGLEIQTKLIAMVEKIARISGQVPLYPSFQSPTGTAYLNGGVTQPTTSATPYSPYPQLSTTPVFDPALQPPPGPPPTLSETIVAAAVAGAVALKQSPIPDAISSAFGYGVASLKSLDQTYRLKDKIIKLGKVSVTKAIDVDRQYQLHQRIGDALLTTLSAFTQATLAYKAAPPYQPGIAATPPRPPVQQMSPYACSQPPLQHQHQAYQHPAYLTSPSFVPQMLPATHPASPHISAQELTDPSRRIQFFSGPGGT